jgi:hypothetical protein
MPVNHTYLKMVELLKTMNFDYHLIMPELGNYYLHLFLFKKKMIYTLKEIDNINESSGKKSTPT